MLLFPKEENKNDAKKKKKSKTLQGIIGENLNDEKERLCISRRPCYLLGEKTAEKNRIKKSQAAE